MNQFMHAAGVLCLILMAAAGGWSLWSTAWLNRHRIAAALRGLPVPPAAEPTIQVQA